jgi:DNA modification methylase
LEPRPDLYVEHLVTIFRAVRRVLRDDGCLWLNLGDSYASGKGSCFNPGGGSRSFPDYRKRSGVLVTERLNVSELRDAGLKPKDLCGVPWRVALALQADGWYLRCDVIWSKPNPMPESVKDRPTRAHEYLFLLSKSERYFYDCDAIREPCGHNRWSNRRNRDASVVAACYGEVGTTSIMRRGEFNPFPSGGRNRRSVWHIATRPYRGAHFATFPPKLVEPCILAGTRPGDLVLDPFAGVATTGLVALQHGRRFVGIEASAKYVRMAERRLEEFQWPRKGKKRAS